MSRQVIVFGYNVANLKFLTLLYGSPSSRSRSLMYTPEHETSIALPEEGEGPSQKILSGTLATLPARIMRVIQSGGVEI